MDSLAGGNGKFSREDFVRLHGQDVWNEFVVEFQGNKELLGLLGDAAYIVHTQIIRPILKSYGIKDDSLLGLKKGGQPLSYDKAIQYVEERMKSYRWIG